MTARTPEAHTSRARRAAGAAVLLAAALLSGCNTAANDPVFARQAAANTGAYPNLNLTPPVATTQFTPYSLAQHKAALAAAKGAQTAETSGAEATVQDSSADAKRLAALGRTHADATIKAIEDQ